MSVTHWQNIYTNKSDDQVSWTQAYPKTAVDYLESLKLEKDAAIIDIGGGASNFADALLDLGYTNITVLDISGAALQRSQERLGDRADRVSWIVSDINNFKPEETYDFWYDRAVFHFLTDTHEVSNYIDLVSSSLSASGHFLLGTFSEEGPLKCSGLEITQYSEDKMKTAFAEFFSPLKCFREVHTTPFGTTQDFQFCGFQKKKAVI